MNGVRFLAGARSASRVAAHPGIASSAYAVRTHALPVSSGRSALFARWNSSKSAPLGLKDGANDLGISPTMKMVGAYITVSMTAMAVIARYKDRDAAEEENARVFNMAKRAVVKDRRFFEAIGYPKEFELIKTEAPAVDMDANAFTEGSFKVIGDKGTAIVTYKQGPLPATNPEDEADDDKKSGLVAFDVLHVRLEDGSEFSARDSYLKNEAVATQQKSQSLGKKLFFPVIIGVVIGGISSFFVIRILRNRPSYVHKLVLDHVNNNEMARTLLGHPIKSNRKDYIGMLSQQAANYSISCRGPKGEGTLIIKAFKDEKDAEREENEAGPLEIMTTPGTAWKFSTLVLSVKRNGSQRAKNSKTINLLAGGGGVSSVSPPPTNSLGESAGPISAQVMVISESENNCPVVKKERSPPFERSRSCFRLLLPTRSRAFLSFMLAMRIFARARLSLFYIQQLVSGTSQHFPLTHSETASASAGTSNVSNLISVGRTPLSNLPPPAHPPIHPSTMNMNNIMNYYYQGRANVPMVSSFSMDVTTFSNDLFDYPPTNPAHSGELRNAFVLCWENVLIPTKWLCQRAGLRPTPKGLQEAKERTLSNPYLQQALATIEQLILQLINAVAACGPVYIVSEESVQFVEAMCKTFFPRLAYCLSSPTTMQGVQVVGAPKKFVSTAEKTAWRVNLLQSLTRDRLFGGAPHLLLDANAGRFGLVVISPHQVDAFACSKTLEIAPFVIPKSVQIANARNLTLDQFCLHLQTLGQYIHQATPCETAFAVTL